LKKGRRNEDRGETEKKEKRLNEEVKEDKR
jgi:hypothetical protein